MQAPHGTGTGTILENPVPGPIGQVLQFGFNLPAWVQFSLVLAGMAVGGFVFFTLWRRREEIAAWLGVQSRGYRIGLGAVGLVTLSSVGAVGYAGNHYMEHNNDFCMSCHVMGDAWNAFQKSEHRKLECHACHRQGMVANVRQLYFWIAERPVEIPEHAKVPTKICAECHVQSRADSNWKRIVRTAGHRLHLESDSSALKEVACVTCHGQEVHRFRPVDKTCGQSGCHKESDTKVVLGKMAGQARQHCTGCHTFLRVAPEDAPTDTLRTLLTPVGSDGSCLGCHQMQQRLKDFAPEQDKGHKAVCGTCHNPHTQKEPKGAYETCANSGCHTNLTERSPVHAKEGPHGKAACGQCHEAHSWQPKGVECVDCHKAGTRASARPSAQPSHNASAKPISRWRDDPIRRGRKARGAAQAARRVVGRVSRRAADARVTLQPVRQVQTAPPTQASSPTQRAVGKPPKDSPSFSHGTHGVLACSGCHRANGALFVRTKADCAGCHHATERPVACEGCHRMRTQLAKPLPATLPVTPAVGRAPRTQQTTFAHVAHRDLECRGCHVQGPLLGVSRPCTSCHVEHHDEARACSACHTPRLSTHTRAAHDGCAGSGCHANAAVLALPASRQVCLACHAAQRQAHYPRRECADCHATHWTPAARPPR